MRRLQPGQSHVERIEELEAEVDRLRGMVHDDAVMLGEQGREIERLRNQERTTPTHWHCEAEIERLTTQVAAEVILSDSMRREIERLTTALRSIDMCDARDYIGTVRSITRAALEGK